RAHVRRDRGNTRRVGTHCTAKLGEGAPLSSPRDWRRELTRVRVQMPAFSPEQWQALSPYLDQALEIPEGERAAWLDTLRKQNPLLAANLQTLLKEHLALDEQGFLQGPQTPQGPSVAGQKVGAYTLESPIGRGGMGMVWLARRSD